MTQPEQPQIVTKNLSLTPETLGVIKTYAVARFQGNDSMAARDILIHFAKCQFPLLGIEQPAPEPAR
jgi:hypothetical protein